MDISTVVLQLVFIFTSIDGNPIYKFQRFCGNNLSNELKKYGCVYHDNTNTFSVSTEGITHECCERPCTAHYLITSYCAHSNMSYYTTQTPPILTNAVNKLNGTFYETGGYPNTNRIVPETSLTRNDIPRDSSHVHSSVKNKVSKLFRGKKNNRGNFKKTNNRNKKLREAIRSSRNKRFKKMIRECVCTCSKRKAKVLPSNKSSKVVVMETGTNPPIRVKPFN